MHREFLEIARAHGVAVVYEDDVTHPGFAALTSTPRDVFLYFINGAKERAPTAAHKVISILG